MDHDDGRTGGAGRDPAAALRVGDTERSAALEALGEHLAAGRLDIDEFGDRSERAAVAVRRADLETLFTDLPAPHPPLPRLPAPVEEPVVRARPAPPPQRRHPAGAAPAFALVMLLVMVLPVLAAGAVATGNIGGLIVLPLLFIVLGQARHGRWHGRGPGGHGPGPRGDQRNPWERW